MTADEVLRLSRKLGFGLRPEEEVPNDFSIWATHQLTSVPTQLGVPVISKAGDNDVKRATIKPWPSKYMPTLETTIKQTVAFRKAMDALEKKYEHNSPDFVEGQRELERKYVLVPWDMLRRAHQAIYGAAPVFERFAHFWTNHFTVAPKEKAEFAFGHYIDAAVKANMVKDFRSMLYDVTTHPSMQVYLDGPYSIGPNSTFGKELRASGQFADINENLGRELLELHSVSPAAGYSQDDIVDVAKILTGHGYTFELPQTFPSKERWKVFFKAKHEPGKKVVMGKSFGTGKDALRELTDFLAVHESTIQHLSRKLLSYFVSDTPNDEDVAYVADAWRSSDGNLPAVHTAVVEIAVKRVDDRKFQQPEVWLYQMLRCSGSELFVGWEQVEDAQMGFDGYSRVAGELLRELGQNYWVERQPNGYSSERADWVSPEHMERRLRFASLAFLAGNPMIGAEGLADRLGVLPLTRTLISKADSAHDQFILFFCSPEMTEA